MQGDRPSPVRFRVQEFGADLPTPLLPRLCLTCYGYAVRICNNMASATLSAEHIARQTTATGKKKFIAVICVATCRFRLRTELKHLGKVVTFPEVGTYAQAKSDGINLPSVWIRSLMAFLLNANRLTTDTASNIRVPDANLR